MKMGSQKKDSIRKKGQIDELNYFSKILIYIKHQAKNQKAIISNHTLEKQQKQALYY